VAPALLAAVAAGLAVWCVVTDPARRVRHLIARDLPAAHGSRGPGALRSPGWRSAGAARFVAIGCAGAAVWSIGGGLPGMRAGTGVAVGLHRWLGTLESTASRARRRRAAADLPAAADLLAACLSSGTPLPEAAAATADAIGGPVGEELSAAVSLHHLGADPIACWEPLTRDPILAPLGQALRRGLRSGAPLVDVVEWLAEDARQQRRASVEAAARRVGVRAAAPVGLCFLPAFVLIGVVPVVIAVAGDAVAVLR
jgi:Flp pilus assembly protein TadB